GAAEAADDPVVAVARRTPGEKEEGRAEASATGPLRSLQLCPCHRQGVPEGRGSALAPAPVEARLWDRRAQEVRPGSGTGLHGPHEAVHRRNLRREGYGISREDRLGDGLIGGVNVTMAERLRAGCQANQPVAAP